MYKTAPRIASAYSHGVFCALEKVGSAENLLKLVAMGALPGAAIGALTADEHKRLEGAGLGALFGAGAGLLGGGLGAGGGAVLGVREGAKHAPELSKKIMSSTSMSKLPPTYRPDSAVASSSNAITSTLGGLSGGLLGGGYGTALGGSLGGVLAGQLLSD